MMELAISVIDAFTDTVFKGNPAAVIILDTWLTDAQMQNIAAENNLSETAFLVNVGTNQFHIRWFSPLTEIDFCGHATLASAYELLINIACYIILNSLLMPSVIFLSRKQHQAC